jgi:hypothetical protein
MRWERCVTKLRVALVAARQRIGSVVRERESAPAARREAKAYLKRRGWHRVNL